MSDSAEERRWTLRRAVATSVGLLVVGVAAFVATLLIESPVRGLLLCIGITSGGLGILGLASVKRSQDSPEKWGTMGRTGKYLVRGYVFPGDRLSGCGSHLLGCRRPPHMTRPWLSPVVVLSVV